MTIFKQLYSNNYFYYFHFGLIFISALFAVFGTILVSPDTHGYINADIYRSLGYPVFIEIHELLFGSYFMFAIKISQFLIFYSCLHYFFKTVKNILKLNDLSSILFFGVLVIPVFYEQKLLNSILTESLSYSLYLLFIGFYCSGIQYNDNKKTYFSYLTLLILLQVRSQFLFIIPVIIGIQLIINHKKALNINTWKPIIIICCIPIMSIIIDLSYHNIKHNKNTTTPFTGIQIASLPFYVSKKQDYKIFETKRQQEYFKLIYSKLEKRHLLIDQVTDKNYTKTDFYFANYTKIANQTLSGDGDAFFTNKSDLNDKIIANDEMSKSMVLPLIMNNLGAYFKIYFQNFTKGIGTSKQLLLFLILLGYFIYNYKKTSIIIVLAILLLLANITLVTLAEHVISRYTFYNNWVLIVIILYLLQNNIKTRNG
jgi:hypothetical protein